MRLRRLMEIKGDSRKKEIKAKRRLK